MNGYWGVLGCAGYVAGPIIAAKGIAEGISKAKTAVNKAQVRKARTAEEAGRAAESGISTITSSDLVFGSSTKSAQKLMNQMNSRGWTEDLIRNTVDNPYTIRTSVNKATGNSATVFYTQQGSYVIVDDVTKAIVQISDNINPSTWVPDLSIVDPYIPN